MFLWVVVGNRRLHVLADYEFSGSVPGWAWCWVFVPSCTLLPPIFAGVLVVKSGTLRRVIMTGVFGLPTGSVAAGIAVIQKERTMSPEKRRRWLKDSFKKSARKVSILSGVTSACFCLLDSLLLSIKVLTLNHGTRRYGKTARFVVFLIAASRPAFIWCVQS